MQLDFKPFNQIDKIAELTGYLTYGDMIDFAAELHSRAISAGRDLKCGFRSMSPTIPE